MMKIIIALLISLISMTSIARAEDIQADKNTTGNKGYIFGSAKDEGLEKSGSTKHRLPNIVQGIKDLDAWIKKNLW